jgi:hypothetical protein
MSEGFGFDSQQRQTIFPAAFRQALGSTQSLIKIVPWTLFPGINWLRHEVDNSLPQNAYIRNVWSYTSTPL